MIRTIDAEPPLRWDIFNARSRALAQAITVAFAFFVIAGAVEASLIRIMQPTELELDWVSDVVLSAALGTAVYLWLHLRATRLALTERERAQLVIQTQLSLAEAMQRRLLPSVPLPAAGFQWAAKLTPAGKIGGDFYDFIEPTPDTRLMLIADVSGKGIAAAMALTLLRSTFRHVGRDTNNPAELAERMSAAFYEEWHGSPYVTCVVALVDLRRRTLTYTNAGHPPGVLVRDRTHRGFSEGGPPLGLLKDAQYVEERLELRVGDVCIFVTDGITESLDHALQRADDVLAAIVREDPRSASRICDAIMERALAGDGPDAVDDWTDDRTAVVVGVQKADRVR
jgi:sigma-B regulation protein RsbU (phosphoserine phosphatase)